jgi:hypothetical protein
MTPLQSIILRNIMAHPGRSHRVIVDVLGDSDWQYAKKVRAELAMMSASGLLVRTGTSARNWTYTVNETPNATQ